jgi:hypothetical protein
MSSRNELNSASQTEFVDQTQLMFSRSRAPIGWQDLKKNKNLLPFYILVGLFIFFVLLFVLRAFMQAPPEQARIIEKNEEIVEVGPLNQRVLNLREALKEHNPTKQRLPFPQVDLRFNIN